MRRLALVALALGSVVAIVVTASRTDASCAYVAPKAISITVDTCAPVDTSKIKHEGYEGVILEGTVDGKKAVLWVPASEKLACSTAKPKTVLAGTLSYACCDGDPNPPCLAGTSSIFTGPTVSKKK